jgi:hypothetical protein
MSVEDGGAYRVKVRNLSPNPRLGGEETLVISLMLARDESLSIEARSRAARR